MTITQEITANPSFWEQASPVQFSADPPTRRWASVAKQIAFLILKIVLFPWGLYALTRYAVQRLIMCLLYPAQSSVFKRFVPVWRLKELDALRAAVKAQYKGEVRDIVLQKNGVHYDGLLIRAQSDQNEWVLFALGNAMTIEGTLADADDMPFLDKNCLLVNGPGVGRSGGCATPETMGDAQEVGLCFLESAAKAKKITLAGFSLGGAAIGQAILQHQQFQSDVSYDVVRYMTFDRVSHICGKVTNGARTQRPWLEHLVQWLVIWSGCEMDCVEASKKLQHLKIPESIYQATKEKTEGSVPNIEEFVSDGLIPAEASLGQALVKGQIIDNKKFFGMGRISHGVIQLKI